jgi:hypothetical protein
MTRIDLHPEDLLDRAARSVATVADLTRLEHHLAECAVCRVERALHVQAADDAAPLGSDEFLVARLTRDVSARLASPTARRSRRKSAFVAVGLAAACLAGGAVAATLALRPAGPVENVSAKAVPSAHAAGPALRAPEPAPQLPREELDTPREPTPADVAPRPARAPALASAEPTNASELFSRANQARRDGHVTEAARLYRALQDRFAGSSEELVSRVSLGRLLLDRLGDSRGALVQFNSYLASPAGGALREEAMVGRALALGRLGRAAEERAAWQALLDASPKSTHRKRAQARLGELAAAGDPPFVDRAGDAKSVGGGTR